MIRHCSFSLSWIPCSGESQLPCHKDTQTALWRCTWQGTGDSCQEPCEMLGRRSFRTVDDCSIMGGPGTRAIQLSHSLIFDPQKLSDNKMLVLSY
jgi:hypothetical protein